MKRKYYPEIDVMRAFAILMVLLYHSILVYPINFVEESFSCGLLHELLWAVEMPAFFFVSGFCVKYKDSYGRFVLSKCIRILIPHFVFGLLDVAVRALSTGLVSSDGSAADGLKDLLIYGGNDWFLLTLFFMMLIAPALYKLINKSRLGEVIAVLIGILCNLLQNLVPEYLSARNFTIFLIFFIVGMLVRKKKDSAAEESSEGSTPFRVIIFILLLAVGLCLFNLMRWYGWTGLYEVWEPVFGEGSFMMGIREILTRHVIEAVDLCRIKFVYLAGILIYNLIFIYLLYRFSLFVVRAFGERGFVRRFLSDCSLFSLQMYLLDGYALVVTRTIMVSVLGMTNHFVVVPLNFVFDTAIVLVISKYILAKVRIFSLLTGIPVKRKEE